MILTEDVIKAASKEARSYLLQEGVTFEKSLRFDAAEQYDLFISHSFKDKDLVVGLKHLFKKAGYKVYIDWIDDAQLDRNRVNEYTASTIKNRMKSCKALTYVSTENTPSSQWCPWELGLGDGMLNKVCILPVMKGDYKGQEYLSLYPYLRYAEYADKAVYDFWLYDQNDQKKYILLKTWIRESKKPYIHN